MHLAVSNLDKHRHSFLGRELALATRMCRRRRIPVPSTRVHLVDLSGPEAHTPASIANRIRIRKASRSTPSGSFPLRCEWERMRQTYQIVGNSANVWIFGGGPEGTVYGFFEYLKRATGIHWYGLTEEDTAFAVPEKSPETLRVPDVPLRGFEYSVSGHDRAFTRAFLLWMVRNSWNLLDLNAGSWDKSSFRDEVIRDARTYGIRLSIGCHAMDHFLPPEQFKVHPEFFGLREGKRCTTAPATTPELPGTWESPIQPCLSNPAARAYLAASIAGFITTHPETDIFALWPHDGSNNWCQCKGCRRTTPYQMLYRLALDILKRIPSTVPIELVSYSNMLDTPKRRLPRSDRTYTLLCPYLRRYTHRFYDPGLKPSQLTLGTSYPEPEPVNPQDDREYGILLDRWKPVLTDIGSTLGIFSYYQLLFHDQTGKSDRSRYLYHPDPVLVEDEIFRYKAHGMQVFYDCSPPYPGFWPDGRFYAYLNDMFWHPNPGARSLIDRYYRATLGAQARDVGNALEAVAALLDRKGNRKNARKVFSGAKKVFGKVRGGVGKRYLLWLAYVEMAWESRQADTAGDRAKVVALEKKISAFFNAHRTTLSDYINISWMKRYSDEVIKFTNKK